MSTDIGEARWIPTTTTFAARLALVRHRMGWNLKEAALACGLPQGSWREWELRGRDPRGMQEVVEKIAGHTGVDDYWLMTGRAAPPPPMKGLPSPLETGPLTHRQGSAPNDPEDPDEPDSANLPAARGGAPTRARTWDLRIIRAQDAA